MNSEIVIDKSFLRAASGRAVKELCESNRALMTEDLLFELFQDERATYTECFRKFPDGANPAALLPRISTLMRFEIENRKACSPIWDHRIRRDFIISERLLAGEFEFPEPLLDSLREWEENLAQGVEGLIDRGTTADELFPHLKGHSPGSNQERIRKIREAIADNMEMIRKFYAAVTPAEFPPAPIVGRRWCVFRWFQVHLLGVLEFFEKYGPGINQTNRETLENESTDLNYLVLALLAGGLATQDKAMARRFRLLRPDGRLETLGAS